MQRQEARLTPRKTGIRDAGTVIKWDAEHACNGKRPDSHHGDKHQGCERRKVQTGKVQRPCTTPPSGTGGPPVPQRDASPKRQRQAGRTEQDSHHEPPIRDRRNANISNTAQGNKSTITQSPGTATTIKNKVASCSPNRETKGHQVSRIPQTAATATPQTIRQH